MLPNLPPGIPPPPPGWMPPPGMSLPPMPPGMKLPPMPGSISAPPQPSRPNVDLWGDMPSPAAPTANIPAPPSVRPPMPPTPVSQSYPYPYPAATAATPTAASAFRPPMPPMPPGLSFPPGMPPMPPGVGAMNNQQRDYNNNNTNRYERRDTNTMGGRPSEPTNTVWLGGQVDRFNDSIYINTFAPFGKIMRLSRLNPQKQTVFVHFRHKEEAQNAIREIQARGTLGPEIRIGFGKQFEYTPEELAIPYDPRDPNQHSPVASGNNTANGAAKRGRDDGVMGSDMMLGGMPRGGLRLDNPQSGGMSASGASLSNSSSGLPSSYVYIPPPARSNEPQPSNVLWVGEIPPTVTTDELRAHFGQFKYRDLSRNDNKGIAFIHFDTLQECQHVLDLMRNVRLRGHLLKLNYGTARKPREEYHAQYGGPPPTAVTNMKRPDDVDPTKEVSSNRLFVGGLPYDVQRAEVDAIFGVYGGFLESRVMAEKHFAFIDFDTAENCASCRYALLPTPVVLKGQTLRISFAKEGHSNTAPTGGHQPIGGMVPMAPAAGSGLINFGTDIYGDRRHQQGAPSMPIIGGAAPATAITTATAAPALVAPSLVPPPTFVGTAMAAPAAIVGTAAALRRQAPKVMSVEERAQSLKGATYGGLAEGNSTSKSLKADAVHAICEAIDSTTSAEGPGCKPLEAALLLHLPHYATHAFAVVAKRLFENYNADPNRKIAVMFVVMRCVLKLTGVAATYSTDAVEAILTVMGITAMNQQSVESIKNIRTFLDHFKKQFFSAGGVHTGKYDQGFIERSLELSKDIENTLLTQEDFLVLMKDM